MPAKEIYDNVHDGQALHEKGLSALDTCNSTPNLRVRRPIVKLQDSSKCLEDVSLQDDQHKTEVGSCGAYCFLLSKLRAFHPSQLSGFLAWSPPFLLKRSGLLFGPEAGFRLHPNDP